VIRHNRDWGTVFLLDDRFMTDRQLSQLSGWLRPRVKKYTNFSAAMKSFRGFVTTASQDKSLVSNVSSIGDRSSILHVLHRVKLQFAGDD
jgi:hypothetical protein